MARWATATDCAEAWSSGRPITAQAARRQLEFVFAAQGDTYFRGKTDVSCGPTVDCSGTVTASHTWGEFVFVRVPACAHSIARAWMDRPRRITTGLDASLEQRVVDSPVTYEWEVAHTDDPRYSTAVRGAVVQFAVRPIQGTVAIARITGQRGHVAMFAFACERTAFFAPTVSIPRAVCERSLVDMDPRHAALVLKDMQTDELLAEADAETVERYTETVRMAARNAMTEWEHVIAAIHDMRADENPRAKYDPMHPRVAVHTLEGERTEAEQADAVEALRSYATDQQAVLREMDVVRPRRQTRSSEAVHDIAQLRSRLRIIGTAAAEAKQIAQTLKRAQPIGGDAAAGAHEALIARPLGAASRIGDRARAIALRIEQGREHESPITAVSATHDDAIERRILAIATAIERASAAGLAETLVANVRRELSQEYANIFIDMAGRIADVRDPPDRAARRHDMDILHAIAGAETTDIPTMESRIHRYAHKVESIKRAARLEKEQCERLFEEAVSEMRHASTRIAAATGTERTVSPGAAPRTTLERAEEIVDRHRAASTMHKHMLMIMLCATHGTANMDIADEKKRNAIRQALVPINGPLQDPVATLTSIRDAKRCIQQIGAAQAMDESIREECQALITAHIRSKRVDMMMAGTESSGIQLSPTTKRIEHAVHAVTHFVRALDRWKQASDACRRLGDELCTLVQSRVVEGLHEGLHEGGEIHQLEQLIEIPFAHDGTVYPVSLGLSPQARRYLGLEKTKHVRPRPTEYGTERVKFERAKTDLSLDMLTVLDTMWVLSLHSMDR